jgi:hypothetical protein
MGFFGQLFGGGASNFNPVIGQATNFSNTDQGQGTSLFGQGQSISSMLTPYFSDMLKNPQGLGATTMAQQLTQAGESTAGGLGTARQHALDIGARTGNTAAIPSMIASADKTGMSNMTNTANDLSIKNAMLKMQQQKEGAAGLSSLFGTDISGAHGFESNANNALSTELSATKDKNDAANQGISNMMKIGGMALGGLGNLDMMGGSSPMEQLMNFAGGM